jgi:hypothetical protein
MFKICNITDVTQIGNQSLTVHKKQPDWWEAFRPSLTDIGEFYQVGHP